MPTLVPPTDDWHLLSLGRGGCARPAPGVGLPQFFPEAWPSPAGVAPTLWAG